MKQVLITDRGTILAIKDMVVDFRGIPNHEQI